MFNLDEIKRIHDESGNSDTLPQYLTALNDIGVTTYDSFIADGHSEYYGKDGHKLVSDPTHRQLAIAPTSDRPSFLQFMDGPQPGYLEMSERLAALGVEKWTFDTAALTLTYYDVSGTALLTETVA